MLKAKRVQTVETSEKTLELLEILAAGGEGLHIGALADKLQISSKKVLLLLVTLECHGMVTWDDRSRKYRTGGRIEALARQILNQPEVRKTDSAAVVSQKSSQSKVRSKRQISLSPPLP